MQQANQIFSIPFGYVIDNCKKQILLRIIKFCLVKEKMLPGAGFWSPPGGHLEFAESFQECAKRELLEETGLEVKEIVQGPLTNDIFVADDTHYITISMITKYCSGEPKVLEPHKCDGWFWFTMNNLPSPLFLPFENLLKQGFKF